ncbi:MAG: (d)CMP kinase [Gemmatimonadota bacterium]
MSRGERPGAGAERDESIVIAIDGPAASGKSTTARRVAERLGYSHLNSGLLYRAIAWVALRDAWPESPEGFDRELTRLGLELERRTPAAAVRVGGNEPGPELTSPETAVRASSVAARPSVREVVLHVLRAAGEGGGVVCDGRDIGTVVFPDARLKVFLVADPAERARRRLRDHGEEETPERLEREVRELVARDERDASRDLAPLRPADDSVRIDTTRLDPGRVVDEILALARSRGVRLG